MTDADDPTRASGIRGNLPATASAAAAATVSTATAGLTFLGLVDPQGATLHLVAIEGLHGLLRSFIVHLDESETARTTGLALVDQGDGVERAVLTEEFLDFSIGGTEGQIAHIELLHSAFLISGPVAPTLPV